MDQIKFMDLGPGGRDSALNVTDPGVREGCVSGWLAETWTKRWSTVCNSEMPEFSWFQVETMTQRLHGTGM